MQYPLDLGSNELGHYILFESGFVVIVLKLVHLEHQTKRTADGGTVRTTPKLSAKVLVILLQHLVSHCTC